jgi:hypothetical protein
MDASEMAVAQNKSLGSFFGVLGIKYRAFFGPAAVVVHSFSQAVIGFVRIIS